MGAIKPLYGLLIASITVVLVGGCIYTIQPPLASTTQVNINVPAVELNLSQVTDSLPTPTPYPKPDYTPALRPYDIIRSGDIWHASDPSSYIQPGNPWIQYYVRTGEIPQINYMTDKDLYPSNPDGDYWQMPDTTIYTGQGDCEDISIVMVSWHIAKGHQAMVIGGTLHYSDNDEQENDFWYEFKDEYGKNTKFTADSTFTRPFTATPKYMFNDKVQWRSYDRDW